MASTGMMNRRVTLLKPPVKEADSFGEMTSSASPSRYPVWAAWKESSGAEVLSEEQEYGRYPVKCTFWWHVALRDVDTTWTLESETGQPYDIFAVTEVGGRRWQIEVSAVRRD